MLEFRILGPLEVKAAGTPVPLVGRNQRALLTLLLLRANEPVSAERLVDQLWGGSPPRTATTSLQNAVSQLRKLLGPGVVSTTPAGYVLVLNGHDFDLAHFEQLVRDARGAPADRRPELLRQALELWRGRALADWEHEDFAQAEIRRLEELRLEVLEERIAAELETGEGAAGLVGELEVLVHQHPLRERFRAQLMLALYRAGRQADALAAYHDARRTLVEELGLEPGPELQELYGAILRQERSLAPAPAPALEDNYDEVVRALMTGRLVPVLGPGAAGASGDDLAAVLAGRFELDVGERGLAYVSQAIAARSGIGPLHDELSEALSGERDRTPLHRWLAKTPEFLRRQGLPQLLIVSTGLDTALERAFAAEGEQLDVVTYIASGRDRGKFLHIPPDGGVIVVVEPNAYTGLALEARPVLLKIHGHVDRSGLRERESFVVSEDDHIDYLAAGEAGTALPVQLAARLRRSHLLFLGYGVHDWSLRVFLRRVWGGDRLAYRSWAVQPACQHIGRELWSERGVDVYEVPLETYVEHLMRVTVEGGTAA